ncbi:DUF5958 family protein [Streptomyces sp. NPDC059697]|uniref:DUF5958 family protein n=1 Tax=Streptomyces sp. NPDC059697 TaxID=3346912 RepID=UPI0036BC67F8
MSSDDGRTFRLETARVVNEIAQGLRTLDAGVGWFSDLAPTRQQEVLQEAASYAMQAHITTADGRAGVARSGVKPTANPSVMICMDPPRYGFASLPAAGHVKYSSRRSLCALVLGLSATGGNSGGLSARSG